MRLVGRWLPGVDQTPIGAAISTSAAESTAWLKSSVLLLQPRENLWSDYPPAKVTLTPQLCS
jgi:hypothetical protein